jgi:lipoate-protein ligase A
MIWKSVIMLSTILESNDPWFNLAAEEYLLHHRSEDFFVLSINDTSVIIGKHQVAHREVNTRYVEENNIPVLRRISGGGTVYHDRGNLNFAFIRQGEQGKQVDFRFYTQPVIDFLKHIGIVAVFEGKNDLTVNGLKISGNAEHVFRERVLHHGTLLFNASLDNMKQSLRPLTCNYATRGVESNRSSVTNLKELLKNTGSTEELMIRMAEYFKNAFGGMHPFNFSGEEVSKIKDIAETKYKTWEWTWGYGPPYTFTSVVRISGNDHHCRLHIKDGIIWECDIDGNVEMMAAGKKLIGCRHSPEDLRRVFLAENIPISDNEIFEFF